MEDSVRCKILKKWSKDKMNSNEEYKRMYEICSKVSEGKQTLGNLFLTSKDEPQKTMCLSIMLGEYDQIIREYKVSKKKKRKKKESYRKMMKRLKTKVRETAVDKKPTLVECRPQKIDKI